ncbi:MAG: isochorismatase family cysteine hydrolase [Candidatus Cryosericum sp.]|nr:cysteine hydrolase [bacterium]
MTQLEPQALLVIDMQRDFLSPASPLFVAGGPSIVLTVQRALQAARTANATVVHVRRSHRPDGIDIDSTRRNLFAAAGGFLVSGTPGADEPPELTPALGDLTVIKTRWSAFFATDLDLLLRRLAIRHLVLAGVQTPNCIRATAMDALSLDYVTSVLSDATASQTNEIQAANLADMAAMGITITSVSQFEESLGL